MSGDAITDQKTATVTVAQATTEGIVLSDKTPPKTETVPIPESDKAAREIVERFERGAEGLRGDEQVADTVSQHMLNDRTSLLDEQWLGTEEEELKASVFSVHCPLFLLLTREI